MRVTVVLGMVLGCIASSTVHVPAGWLGDYAGMPSGGTEVCDSGCALGAWSNGCDCDNCLAGYGVVDPYCRLLPSDGRLKIYGWLNGGFIGNTSSPNSKFNGPHNAVDRSNEPMFNQGYLVGEYGLPLDGSWGLGGRVDALYGEDFLLAQSVGMEVRPDLTPRWNSHEYYGLAIPQAYMEVGRTDLSLKIGHFYTPIGYEGVPAPANFFYSKSYSYMFAGPFTHWGGLMTWNMASGWQTQLGLTNGWNALDRVSDHVGVLAGIKYTEPCERWWSSFAITTGEEFNNLADLPGVVPDFDNRTRYSWLVFISLTERLDYVFHQWLGFQADGAPAGERADWYGLDHYAYYTINERWRAGVRYEWFRDEEGTRIGLNRPSNPNNPPLVGDAYSIACGLNWTPYRNLMLRPEVRWDYFDGDAVRQPFEDGDKDNQLMVGFDGILHF